MATQEKVIPDRVWKRRWSSRWFKNVTIVYGIFIGSLGLIMDVLIFQMRSLLSDAVTRCIAIPACVGSPGGPTTYSPILQTSMLSGAVLAIAGGVIIGGFVYAFNTWRVKEREWAAVFGLQPLARLLETWHAQGRISKEQLNEIIGNLTGQ